MALGWLYLCTMLTLVSTAVLSSQDFSTSATASSYDYIVVGCGIAGLVVSMRLSEDENVSVVCVEAGRL